MVVSDLTEREGIVLLGLARLIVEADHVLHDEEAEMLGELSRELGMDGKSISNEGLPLEEQCSFITRREAQACIFLELALLACVDGEYVGSEREVLLKIAGVWKVQGSTVSRVEAWAQRRILLSREAAEIAAEISHF